MPTSTTALPWSHFYIHAGGRITGFNPDTCEHCGADIQAANSITLVEPPARLLALGLTQSPTLPEEGYYSDDIDGEACYNCNA